MYTATSTQTFAPSTSFNKSDQTTDTMESIKVFQNLLNTLTSQGKPSSIPATEEETYSSSDPTRNRRPTRGPDTPLSDMMETDQELVSFKVLQSLSELACQIGAESIRQRRGTAGSEPSPPGRSLKRKRSMNETVGQYDAADRARPSLRRKLSPEQANSKDKRTACDACSRQPKLKDSCDRNKITSRACSSCYKKKQLCSWDGVPILGRGNAKRRIKPAEPTFVLDHLYVPRSQKRCESCSFVADTLEEVVNAMQEFSRMMKVIEVSTRNLSQLGEVATQNLTGKLESLLSNDADA
ncbi:hypothetical protein CPB86DRAFT_374030 [Serendipita vermifera]|nr:hypothetical protein CPB86DRAFT_374030 [Serendipita vermifera]